MKFIAAIIIFAGLTFPAFAEFNGKPCQCRHQGGKVDEGTVMCIATPSGSKMMICEMVLNNSSWRVLQNGCAVGNLQISPRVLSADVLKG